MRNAYTILFSGLGVLFLATGCSSISTLQTAETTKKGSTSHAVAVGQITADVNTASGVKVESDDANEDTISLPMVEYMFRYGATDNIDVGFRTTGTVHSIDGKWKFLDSGSFKMATGLGLNYLNYTISVGAGTTTEETEVTAMDVVVPLFMDFDMSDNFTFYLVPKYMSRNVSVDSTSGGSDSETVGYAGGSVGIKWGKDWGLLVEYSMMSGKVDNEATGSDDTVKLSQAGVGLFFN